MIWRRPDSWVLQVALLAASVAIASVAHSKAPSIEPLDAVFETTAPGTIEASLDPPIHRRPAHRRAGRCIRSRTQPGGSDGVRLHQSERQPLTLEVTQSGPAHSLPARQPERPPSSGRRPALLARRRYRRQRSHPGRAGSRPRSLQSHMIRPNSKATPTRSSIDPAAPHFGRGIAFTCSSVK